MPKSPGFLDQFEQELVIYKHVPERYRNLLAFRQSTKSR